VSQAHINYLDLKTIYSEELISVFRPKEEGGEKLSSENEENFLGRGKLTAGWKKRGEGPAASSFTAPTRCHEGNL